jgi:hypothetical protein
MAQISIAFDMSQVAVFRNQNLERALERAASKAGRDGIRMLKSASSKRVREKKRLRVKRVNQGLPVTFPKGRALEDLVWTMDVEGTPVPLFEFPHRQVRWGVSAAINTGKRALVKSAFVATMKSGHTGVFVRVPSGQHGPLTKKQSKGNDVFRVGRLPIKELFSTRVSDVFRDEGMIPAMQTRAMDAFSRTFDRVLPLEIEKL